jgi:LEA14-like dessication related protein
MRASGRAAIAALVMLVPMTACSLAYRQPEVRLDGVRVGSIGLRGGLLYADLHVTNPNGFDLETSGLTYDLQLADPKNANEWVTAAKGNLDETFKVEGHRGTVIQVPIQFRFEDLGGALRSVLETGTFNYRVSGDVQLKEPVGRTIPYRKTGIVTMSGTRN